MQKDERLTRLAQTILNNSVRLKQGEKVFIETFGSSTVELLTELIKQSVKIGAVPFYLHNDVCLRNAFFSHADEKQINEYAAIQRDIMEQMDAYIAVRCYENPLDNAMSADQQSMYNRFFMKPVHMDVRIPRTKWCLLYYPNPTLAFQANMSTQAFEDFYFSACLTDYSRMYQAMLPLKELMDQTDNVRIVAPGTDLTFSIKGIGATPCHGLRNIPDGEIYTAPVRHSVNGKIRFNTLSTMNGIVFRNLTLTFHEGKVVQASADANQKDLEKILDTDEGARYLGEFAFGVNPFIKQAIGNTLFDEKISGSIHIALGNFCGNAYNGNKSAIHWDLVQIQTPQYGGGEIWFDNVLICRNGQFVLPQLLALN